MSRKNAIYGLSGDPITNGHLWVIEKSIDLFDHLTVVIANNPSKKYTFTLQERVNMAKEIIYEIDSDFERVHVDTIENQYLSIYTQDRNIKWMVRGIRNERDFSYEREMSHVNSELASNVNTVFLIPPKNLDSVSSSFIKSMIGPDDWEEFIRYSVPDATYKALVNKFSTKKKKKQLKDGNDIPF